MIRQHQRHILTLLASLLVIIALLFVFGAIESRAHFVGASNAERAARDSNFGGWCGRGWDWWCSGPKYATCNQRAGYHSYYCDARYFESKAEGPWSYTIQCGGRIHMIHYDFYRWLEGPGWNRGCDR